MRLLPAAILFLHAAVAAAARLDAPNIVPITDRLTTAGQPTAASLAALKDEGYGAVIYLAPPTVPDAVKDEPKLVQDQGIAFVNIPIQFDNPTPADFDAFAAALASTSGRKVLVHCQVNLRASSMVFLHRVIVGKEPAEKAYDSVKRVWVPNRVWKAYIVSMLRRHGSDFEPY
jgi:protein tyrosine phosphatase (PTP) superfamily phosphohydrolase (DUF442 family)